MFTGLIEAVGKVAGITQTATGLQVHIESTLVRDLQPGDSLAVNGVCLTAAGVEGTLMHADIGPETARVTTLGTLRPNQLVNLERPLKADGRLGGHFVQGHVDGTGRVARIRQDGDARLIAIGFDERLAPLLIPKGSVAVDGISLTVAGLHASEFEAMIVPFTWDHTNVHTINVGDRVNLECDMIGKYVARALEMSRLPSTRPWPG